MTDDARERSVGLPASSLLPYAVPSVAAIAGMWVDPCFAWGFSYWALPAPVVSLSLLLLALAITVAVAIPRVAGVLIAAAENLTARLIRVPRIPGIVLGSAAVWVVLFVLRSKAHVYGDGFAVLEAASRGLDEPVHGQMLFQPLSVVFFRSAVPWLRDLLTVSNETAFAALNCLGGTLAVMVLWRLAGVVGRRSAVRIAAFATFLTSGSTILFFGVIEHYTWPTALGLWSMYLAARYRMEGTHRWTALICALVAAAFHLVALPFLAAIAATVINRETRWFSVGRILALAAVAVTGGVVACHLLCPLRWFVPPWPTGDGTMWPLSGRHIADVLNQCLLVAPLALGAILLRLTTRRGEGNGNIGATFAGVVALFAGLNFLAALWLDPTIGAARDWDLLSFYGLPATVWAGAVIFDRVTDRNRAALVVPALVALLVQLGPNLMEKRDLAVSVARLDSILVDCPQHRPEYDGARRALVWGVLMKDSAGRPDLAEKHFRRRLEGDSACASAWHNLGELARDTQHWSDAESCYAHAVLSNPDNPFYLYRLAEANEHLGQTDSAARCALRATALKPDEAPMHTLAGVLLWRQGRISSGMQHLATAHRLDPSAVQPVVNLAILFAGINQHDSACAYFAEAIRLSPGRPELYEGLIVSSLALGHCRTAEETLMSLAAIQPGHPRLRDHRAGIAACRAAETSAPH